MILICFIMLFRDRNLEWNGLRMESTIADSMYCPSEQIFPKSFHYLLHTQTEIDFIPRLHSNPHKNLNPFSGLVSYTECKNIHNSAFKLLRSVIKYKCYNFILCEM